MLLLVPQIAPDFDENGRHRQRGSRCARESEDAADDCPRPDRGGLGDHTGDHVSSRGDVEQEE